jgi:hypothetical protein
VDLVLHGGPTPSVEGDMAGGHEELVRLFQIETQADCSSQHYVSAWLSCTIVFEPMKVPDIDVAAFAQSSKRERALSTPVHQLFSKIHVRILPAQTLGRIRIFY